jgi:hypothetical protein
MVEVLYQYEAASMTPPANPRLPSNNLRCKKQKVKFYFEIKALVINEIETGYTGVSLSCQVHGPITSTIDI